MSKIAFIYPGQGAQKVGMGSDFYEQCEVARQIYDQASELLGFDMKALCFSENEQLDQTEYTQAAMVTTCMAMTKVLEDQGIHPHVTAGLSLGEYSAIATAGGMSTADAITLVRTRGVLMQQAVPAGEGAMAAVLGLEAEVIDQAIADIDGVGVANYNCPGQIVITGQTKSVNQAAEVLKEAGAKRVLPLNVSGPFHSEMLRAAGQELAQVLEKTELQKLRIPYVSNVTANYVADAAEMKDLLARQVATSVLWQQSMEQLIADGVDTFVEIGPGKTLTGFLKKIDKQVKSYNVSVLADVEKVVQELC